MSTVRSEAARVIAAVLDGRSLKLALAPAEAAIADPRDRALLHAIVLASVRGALRWQAIVRRLLERPLPARAGAVQAALIAGLAQIEDLGLPAHAVVDETVAAVRALRQPRLAALANAVLRRWLRERELLLAEIERSDESARSLHPAWLLQRLRDDWPQHWAQIVAAGNAQAPLWLRVNLRRNSREEYRARLAAAGLHAQPHGQLPDALCLSTPVPVSRLPGFADGLVSIQDAAAQYAAHLLAAEPGQRVLDACAAPGGKSAHLLERTPGLSLLALDREPERLGKVGETLTRLGLGLGVDGPAPQLHCGDAARPETWWDGQPFQRILLDAPCSATGIVRRQPDVRLHRRPRDIPALAAQQAQLLRTLWPLLAPGGRLLYAVCSLLRAESETVLVNFLSDTQDARSRPVVIAGAQPLVDGQPDLGVQILPGCAGMDGFAYALLVKR